MPIKGIILIFVIAVVIAIVCTEDIYDSFHAWFSDLEDDDKENKGD